MKSVRVYDTFTTKLFDEYIPLDEVFILQKRTNSNPIGIERSILRKEDSLLVALINNESIEKAIKKYGKEGFAVSEYGENIFPSVLKVV